MQYNESMNVLASHLQHLKVMSLQTGEPVATTTQPIINPDTLTVVAFGCDLRGRAKSPEPMVLLTPDIRQVGRHYLIIDSDDEISEARDLVRLKDVIQSPCRPIGLIVVTESGQKLGKVEEFTVELNDFTVKKLYVRPGLLKSMLVSSLVIDRGQVVDVTPKQIVVRDATAGTTEPVANLAPMQPEQTA
jgi:uncharacterized protein YrrD